MTNFMKETLTAVADRIMAGYRLQKDDAIVQEMLTLPLEDLQREAGRLQKHFCGNHVDFCTIINARSGRCGENCKYCAQAACHHTDCEEYGFLPKEEIMKVAKADQDAGANRFSLVTSGRALTGKDFEKALDTYQEMHKTLTIDLCASHGIISREQFRRLREGADEPPDVRLLFFRGRESAVLICQQLHSFSCGDVSHSVSEMRRIPTALEIGRDQYDPCHVPSSSNRRC